MNDADLAEHLAAGRRAAFVALRVMVNNDPRSKWEAREPEEIKELTSIGVNGGEIMPAIDAAILETIARLGPPLIVTAESKLRYLRPGELPL